MGIAQMIADVVRTVPAVAVEEYDWNVVFTTANDWKVSIGYGPHHYGSARWADTENRETIRQMAGTVEVAMISPSGHFFQSEDMNDSVRGWEPITNIPNIVQYVSGF